MTEHIPNPEKFNINCSQPRSFLGLLRIKFVANHDCLPDEQSQIIYALSLLDKTVVLMVAPLMDTGVLPCNQIDKFIALFEALYGNPDRQATAKQELDGLRQINL
jgi:hypothetical protein